MHPCPTLRVASRLRALAVALAGLCALAAFAAPNPPAGLVAIDVANTTDSVRLDWQAPSPVGGTGSIARYKIYRKGPGDSVPVFQGQTANGSTTYWTQSGLNKFNSYEYFVSAVDTAGSNNESPRTAPVVHALKRFDYVLPWDDVTTSATTDFGGWNTPIGNTNASRIYKGANGTFRVGSTGGPAIRFLGVNLSAAGCFPAHADAPKIARRMAQFGINLVRLHQMDQAAPKGVFADGSLQSLDTAQMGRLAYFVNELKANGIYVDLNLRVLLEYPNIDNGNVPERFKGVDVFSTDTGSPSMRSRQKTFAQQLLTYPNGNHVAGMGTYANDPGVALVEIGNEDGLISFWASGGLDKLASSGPSYYAELGSKWTSWLATRYGTDTALAAAWSGQSAGSHGQDTLPSGASPADPGPVSSPWQVQVISPAAATASWVDGASVGSPSGHALSINVTTAEPAVKWHVQALLNGITLDAGTTHTLRFFGKVASGERDFRVVLRNGSGSIVHSIASFRLSSEWQEFTVAFPAIGTHSGTRTIGFTDFAAQTGQIHLAGFSLSTGDEFLGPLYAAAESGTAVGATNILTSSSAAYNFPASGNSLPSNWTLGAAGGSGASTSWTYVAGGRQTSPTAINSLRVQTTRGPNPASGDITLLCARSLGFGKTYTLSFDVKASVAGTFVANGQGHSQAGGVLFYPVFGSREFDATTTWTHHTVAFTVSEDNDFSSSTVPARFTFGLGAMPTGAEIEFANISLKEGGAVGLPSGESLAGGVAPIRRDVFQSRFRAVQSDWVRFLWETELAFWEDMKAHVKTTLGTQALLIGTQGEYSPTLLQAEAGFDVIDAHGYWQHPNQLKNPWYFRNRPMTGADDANLAATTLPARAGRRIIGKPYTVSEYNHPAPNTYGTEGYPLFGAYAALQGWQGVMTFDYENYIDPATGVIGWARGSEGWFAMGRAPAKMITLPAARAMIARGHVATPYVGSNLSGLAFAAVNRETAIQKICRTLTADIGAMSFGVPAALAYVMPVGLKNLAADVPAHRSVPAASPSSPYSPASGQLAWDTAAKRVLIKSPLSKAALGNLPTAGSLDLGHGVFVSSPGGTKLQGTASNWACFVLTRKDTLAGQPFGASGTRWLLTTTGYADNHFVRWIANQGPTAATSSVSHFGTSPTLLESIGGQLTFNVPSGTLVAHALDAGGDPFGPALAVSYSGSGSARTATVTLPDHPLTPWYEMYVTP